MRYRLMKVGTPLSELSKKYFSASIRLSIIDERTACAEVHTATTLASSNFYRFPAGFFIHHTSKDDAIDSRESGTISFICTGV